MKNGLKWLPLIVLVFVIAAMIVPMLIEDMRKLFQRLKVADQAVKEPVREPREDIGLNRQWTPTPFQPSEVWIQGEVLRGRYRAPRRRKPGAGGWNCGRR